MKKVKFEGKLNLNKETIAKLNDEQLNSINGGAEENYPFTIIFCSPFPFTSMSIGCTVATTGATTQEPPTKKTGYYCV